MSILALVLIALFSTLTQADESHCTRDGIGTVCVNPNFPCCGASDGKCKPAGDPVCYGPKCFPVDSRNCNPMSTGWVVFWIIFAITSCLILICLVSLCVRSLNR